jgi:hypothetical protein
MRSLIKGCTSTLRKDRRFDSSPGIFVQLAWPATAQSLWAFYRLAFCWLDRQVRGYRV